MLFLVYTTEQAHILLTFLFQKQLPNMYSKEKREKKNNTVKGCMYFINGIQIQRFEHVTPVAKR